MRYRELMVIFWVLATAFGCRLFAAGFNFQGQLLDAGRPASGTYSMVFRLFDGQTKGSAVGQPISLNAVSVTNGLFSVMLDFGTDVFGGVDLWIETGIKNPEVDADFTLLAPRQALGIAPIAIRAGYADSTAKAAFADSVPWANVTGIPSTITWANQRIDGIFGESSSKGLVMIKQIGDPSQINWTRENSTFSGFGQSVGVMKGFSAVQLYVRAWNVSYPISKVRCRIKELDYSGPVIADATVSVSSNSTQSQLVTIELSPPVENSAGKPLWLEYFTDGRTGQTVVLNPNGPPPGQYYSTSGSVELTSMVPATTSVGFYVAFLQKTNTFNDSVVSDSFKEKLDVIPTKDTVHINLPDRLYALEGQEFSIYFANIVRANVPLESLEVDVSTAFGNLYDRFWRIVPTAANVGKMPLTVNIRYANRLVTSKSSVLVIAPANAANLTSEPRQLLMIGDSTTANGIMAGELARMYASDTNQLLALRGGKGVAPVLFEATAGWKFSQFYSASDSPFVFDGVFDFGKYIKNRDIKLFTNDWVTFNLGINDVFGIQTDAELSPAIAGITAVLRSMISSVQTASPGVRVGVCLTIPPPAGQDSFGFNYNSRSWARYRYNNHLLVEELIRSFGGQEKNGVFLIPIHVNLDTFYNFTSQKIPVNARNPTITFTSASNGIHPAESGYYQIADSFRYFIKANQ